MSKLSKMLLAVICVASFSISCKKDIEGNDSFAFKKVADYDHKVVWDWNEMLLQVERYAAGYRPGPISASVAYLNLASYEAVIAGMPDYNSMASRYAGLNVPQINLSQEYHWPTVVNKVNEVLMTRMFPKEGNTGGNSIKENYNINVDKVRELYLRNEAKYKTEASDEVILRSRTHGEAVALAFWDWFKTDVNAFEMYKDVFGDYDWTARTNPGRWVPTIPGPGKGMFPYWGKVKTLAISESQKLCRPYEYYIGKFSEEVGSGIDIQAREVMFYSTSEKSEFSTWVGQFWSDDLLGLTFSPPLRFFAIADQVYDKEKTNLEVTIYCNAKLGLACHDAGVGAWNSKYYYNLERPESYVKRMLQPEFEPILAMPGGDSGITPSFPAYPSGHATFGAAAAAVLTEVFGNGYRMTDNCHKDRADFNGTPRYFDSFDEMAQENAFSRVPLGVHFRCDAEEGYRFGQLIGTTVNELPWKK
jgi:hypothetical protein